MQKILDEIREFTAPGTDRLSFLKQKLAENGVETSVIKTGGKNHLCVNFPSVSFDARFKSKTLVAHYDVAPGGAGANDNSAACIALADFACAVYRRAEKGLLCNIRIFFTDGEELGSGGVQSQGSFALAEIFKKCGISGSHVYVFDACGRGDFPVLAKAGVESLKGKSSAFAREFSVLFETAQKILEKSAPDSWAVLPVPYSDNAGFLVSGVPAVQITFLPKDEAASYRKNLSSDPQLEKAVMNSTLAENADFKFKYMEKVPYTWKLFHTEFDNEFSLTPESFPLLEKIFNSLLILN